MTRGSKIAALLFMLVTIGGIAFFAVRLFDKKESLPVLGEPGHTAGDFSFVNQDGNTYTDKDVNGKVTVVEYFFTTCPGICKQMNNNLLSVYETYKDDPGFVILSHTVDPETDSVPVLKSYAEQMRVSGGNWQFLTGDKYALYKEARQDYLLSVEEGPDSDIGEDFIHTQYVSLLDKQRRIRGFYDATDSAAIQKLIKDIAILL